MTVMLLFLILILSLVFTRLAHPLSMGLTLLMQTVAISLIAGTATYSFWFSYILFLIFLGGMLILFIYVSSLASNEPFSFSSLSFLGVGGGLLVFSGAFMLSDLLSIPLLTAEPSSSLYQPLSSPFIISWIYSENLMVFTLFIVLYLLLTLVVVIKITSLFKGPLRLSS